jgi:hypothetical protein
LLVHDAGQFRYTEADRLDHRVTHSHPSSYRSWNREALVVLIRRRKIPPQKSIHRNQSERSLFDHTEALHIDPSVLSAFSQGLVRESLVVQGHRRVLEDQPKDRTADGDEKAQPTPVNQQYNESAKNRTNQKPPSLGGE